MTKMVDRYEIDGHRIRLRREEGDGVASITSREQPAGTRMGSSFWRIIVDGIERGAIGAAGDDQPNDVYDRLEKWWQDQQTTNARFPDSPSPSKQRGEGQPPRE